MGPGWKEPGWFFSIELQGEEAAPGLIILCRNCSWISCSVCEKANPNANRGGIHNDQARGVEGDGRRLVGGWVGGWCGVAGEHSGNGTKRLNQI